MNPKDAISLLFYRPREPIFLPKGEKPALFYVPENYYTENYTSVNTGLADRFSSDMLDVISVNEINLPDLSMPMQLKYDDHFSIFIPSHRQWAGKLIDILMGLRDLEDLKSVCVYCQPRINPYMLNYCLSVVILHRPDTKGMTIPTLAETFPDRFMDSKVFRRAREIANTVTVGVKVPIPIPLDYTASDNDPEHRVAYFREDIGVNLHHWHWHLVYPSEVEDRSIVAKDRRGELFCYMHAQILARYSAERLCNNLGQVVRYSDFRAPIKEGYFPKMNSSVASRTVPPRFADTTIKDLDRPVERIRMDVNQMEIWRDRIIQAVESGTVMLPSGRTQSLDEKTGLDILGDMLEASTLSINKPFYGDLHNMGHTFIAYAHDPDNRHLEQHGVIGDLATAMRDPAFYRWHAYVDDIIEIYRKRLPPYSKNVLDFPGISVSSISVEGPGGLNTFSTYWEQNTLNLARGLDFAPGGRLLATFTHLQHEECNYVIEVNNTSGKSVMGTFRIFMSPISDENGKKFPFNEQRRLMIELDKFTQPLRTGKNTIRQSSVDSSVTIPFERTFRDQDERPGKEGTAKAAQFDFCGCGWPHHMLYPKGTSSGYPVVLFVMISDWNVDRVEQDVVGTCNDSASYCGLKDRLYPDRRAMGFPFDRLAQPNVNDLSDFLLPNMATRDCVIRFADVTRTGLTDTKRKK